MSQGGSTASAANWSRDGRRAALATHTTNTRTIVSYRTETTTQTSLEHKKQGDTEKLGRGKLIKISLIETS